MTRLPPFIRRAFGGAQPEGVVLLYHRVTELESDPHHLAVSPARFKSHLDAIVRLGVPMSLAAMLDAARRGSLRAGAVAVTFDDGYADNLTSAAPLLAEAGVPATIFLSTGAIVNGREFWWDELERIDPCPAQCSGTRAPRQAHRPLVAEEVKALAAIPGITIGSHTVNHPSLAALPPEAQYLEIARARSTIEALIARPVELFAYPFGGRDDLSAETIGAARRAGVTIACTTIGGRVTRATDPMLVPRAVVRDWSADEFARRFAGWAGVPAR